MDKLKELWEYDKKKAIIIGSITLVSLIIVILAVILLMNLFKKYDYIEIETIMVEATEKYLRQHKEYYPSENTKDMSVDASSLISNELMNDFSKLSKDTNCIGEVHIKWNNNKYYYEPYLECDNYQTKNIYQTLTKEEDGIYDLNGYKTYRGEFVNNYINFAGYSWRIVKFDNTEIFLILSDTVNSKMNYVYDDRYNESINSYRGKNTFENSRIYDTLKNIYQNDFTNYQQYLLTIHACAYPRSETETNVSGFVECLVTTDTMISLLPVYDYMNASLDPMCENSISRNCSNYNYLAKASNKWWLLNGTNENTYEVYYSDMIGKIGLASANSKNFLRPVIKIPSTLIYKNGNGSQNNPYTIQEY